jgi:catechol 2,3-dioxygenase-like lactoylglutathione lyase family enzyme
MEAGRMTQHTVPLTAPDWAGINHLALVTDDMDATVRFWHGVLGAELVATIGTPSFRHYFFRIGDGQTVAFFEYRDVELAAFAKPAGIPYEHASQFDHVALGLPSEASLLAMRDRLTAHGCEVTEVVDHGLMRSIYFTDPTGIALEASYWAQDVDDPATHDERFGDTDPVPAVLELREHGRLLSTPETKLVDGVVTAG